MDLTDQKVSRSWLKEYPGDVVVQTKVVHLHRQLLATLRRALFLPRACGVLGIGRRFPWLFVFLQHDGIKAHELGTARNVHHGEMVEKIHRPRGLTNLFSISAGQFPDIKEYTNCDSSGWGFADLIGQVCYEGWRKGVGLTGQERPPCSLLAAVGTWTHHQCTYGRRKQRQQWRIVPLRASR